MRCAVIPAAEGFARAVQGQVTDPNFAQVAQPRFRLLEQSFADFRFRWREFQALGPCQGVGSGHAEHFRQVRPPTNILCAFTQARAVARGARGAATVPAEHDAELNFVALLLEVGEKRVQPLESFATFPDQVCWASVSSRQALWMGMSLSRAARQRRCFHLPMRSPRQQAMASS